MITYSAISLHANNICNEYQFDTRFRFLTQLFNLFISLAKMMSYDAFIPAAYLFTTDAASDG